MPYDDEDPPYVEPDAELNALSHSTLGAAIEVHTQLGPGLDEALYEEALALELTSRNIEFARQVWVDVLYKGQVIGKKRIDFSVGGRLVVEIKTVEILSPLHAAQVRTYLKIMNMKLGLLINFNVAFLKQGIKRVLNPT